MATETIKHLADLSKKSVQNVEQVYNQLMDQLKKTNIIYKQYQQTKDPLQKNKLYSQYMGEFMIELKKKLGINKDLQVEDVGSISTTSMGSPTTADGQKAPFGSSAIFAQRMGMSTRSGGNMKPLKKKNKKRIRESEEYLDNFLGN